jgi:5-methylcytosine-specific restriction endonuclease McrA
MTDLTQTLHSQALSIAARFHKAESELIDILQKIDDQKIFMKLGYSSLFDYAVRALKLSEANAYNFITIARKSKTIPELKIAIASGELTVSKARKITPILTRENSSHWLELARTLSKQELEKAVARVMPQTATSEGAKYVSGNRLELKLGVSEDLLKKLRRAQDLTSQKTRSPASFEETLSEVLEFFLQRNDPVEKAKRNSKQIPEPVPGQAPLHRRARRYISANTKHQIHLRDQGRCAHKDKEGQRCGSRRWLEIHHQIPLSQNGSNGVQNLKTLCHNHHKLQHLF